MPWFLRRRKKKHKKVVSCKDDAVVTATSQPAFAVVVQDFESSVSDQICVERGQVVESLFSEEDWIYIRNVDGHCGYIPANFCFPLEKLRTGLPGDEGDKVRQLRAHPRPTTIHVDTFDAPPEEEGEEVGGEGEEAVNSPDSGISCSQQASSTNMDSVHSFHNTRERLVGGGRDNRADFVQLRSHRRTVDREAESNRSPTHVVRHPGRHKHFHLPNTSLPLLETVVGNNGDSPQQPCNREPHSPSPPPLQPVSLADLRTQAVASGDDNSTTDGHVATATIEYDGRRSGASSDGDDVFLPEARKPVGIYQCSETYEPQFEGEIPLLRDEIVVVMEVGKGEYVLAVGSENKEGLVPKSLLHKYRPDLPEEEEEEEEEVVEEEGEGEFEGDEEEGAVDETEVGEEEQVSEDASEGATIVNLETVSSATQTELIINGVVHEITSSIRQSRDTLASPVARDTATVSIQTEFTSPNWFKNNTPRTTPNNTLTRSTAVTTGTTPHPHQRHSMQSSSLAHPSSPPRVLCIPRVSQNSTSSATAATSPPAAAKRHPRYTNTPSGRHLPLTPVATPAATPAATPLATLPSISLQTPTGTSGARTLVDVSKTTTAADESSSRNAGSAACNKPWSQVGKKQQVATDTGAGRTLDERGRGHLSRPGVASVAPGEGTGTMQRHRQALSQHTRIVTSIPFEPDNEASTAGAPHSMASTRRRMQPTPIVTATRDYSPPRQAKNALVLRRGDIMYAQPHVPYPHGWVWVYHTLLKKYGYVPKDCIAYMYLVQKDQSTILEDIV